MSDLVSLAEFEAFLQDPDVNTELATAALEAAEDLFTRACGRADRPFQAAEEEREEVKDGTGTRELYLDYAIDELDSVVLGADPDEPDETLDIEDVDVLRYRGGKRKLTRMDGVFGCKGNPNVVHVTYNASADLPPAAAQAVKAAAALLYRQGSADGVTSEQLGSYRVDVPSGITKSLIEQLPAWQEGLRVCGEHAIA